MTENNVYYGAAETVPKGKKRTNMTQAVDKGQVRYYGIKKVDQLIVNAKSETIKVKRAKKNKVQKLLDAIVKLSGQTFKLNNDIPYSKTDQEKKDIRKRIKLLKSQIKTKKEELKSLTSDTL